MKPYKHFTTEERKCLQHFLSEGLSFRQIADLLERSPSTISREVNRNKAKYKQKGTARGTLRKEVCLSYIRPQTSYIVMQLG